MIIILNNMVLFECLSDAITLKEAAIALGYLREEVFDKIVPSKTLIDPKEIEMQNKTFEVSVPASLLEYGFDKNQIQQSINEWLVLSLYTEGKISSGKSANLLNITRLDFLELLRRRGFSYIDFTPEEWKDEMEAVNKLSSEVKE